MWRGGFLQRRCISEEAERFYLPLRDVNTGTAGALSPFTFIALLGRGNRVGIGRYTTAPCIIFGHRLRRCGQGGATLNWTIIGKQVVTTGGPEAVELGYPHPPFLFSFLTFRNPRLPTSSHMDSVTFYISPALSPRSTAYVQTRRAS